MATVILDFAAHMYPEEVFPKPMAGSEHVDLVGEKLWNPDALVDFYTESGYDGAVLSQPFHMGSEDLEETARANDAMLEVIHDYEEFWGLASIPVRAGGSAAAEEFERCLANGFHGGGIQTPMGDVRISDDILDPVYDVAEAHDAPIMVHPKLENSLGEEVFHDDGRLFLNSTFGRETALCDSVVTTIQDGVFDAHPDLKLSFHHLAGNIAAMLGRVHLYQVRGWWPDQDDLWGNDEFREVLESNVYMDTSGYLGYMPPLQAALEEFPTSQILLGTDCPFEARNVEDMTVFLRVIADLTSHSDRQQILGGNTLDILANV